MRDRGHDIQRSLIPLEPGLNPLWRVDACRHAVRSSVPVYADGHPGNQGVVTRGKPGFAQGDLLKIPIPRPCPLAGFFEGVFGPH